MRGISPDQILLCNNRSDVWKFNYAKVIWNSLEYSLNSFNYLPNSLIYFPKLLIYLSNFFTYLPNFLIYFVLSNLLTYFHLPIIFVWSNGNRAYFTISPSYFALDLHNFSPKICFYFIHFQVRAKIVQLFSSFNVFKWCCEPP